MLTERVLRLEDRGVKHSNLKTGAPDEREAHQSAAPADARGHERRVIDGELAQLAQFHAGRGSRFVAAALIDQWVTGGKLAETACSGDLGSFRRAASQI